MKSSVSGILLSLALLTACGEDSSIRSMPQTAPVTVQLSQSAARDVDANPPFLPFIKRFAQEPLGQPEEKLSQFVYVRTRCNIRSGPGITYSVIRKASKGENLEYVFLGGNW